MNRTDLIVSIKEILRQEFPKITEYEVGRVTGRILYSAEVFAACVKEEAETKCLLQSLGNSLSTNEVNQK